MDDYLTVEQAATEIGVAIGTIRLWIRRKKVQATKKGWFVLIHKDEVDRIVKQRSKAGKSK